MKKKKIKKNKSAQNIIGDRISKIKKRQQNQQKMYESLWKIEII